MKKSLKETLKDAGLKTISSKMIAISILLGFVLYFINSFVADAFAGIIALLGYESLPTTQSATSFNYGILFKEFILSLYEEKDVKLEKVDNEYVKDKVASSDVGEISIGNNLSDLAYKVAKCCNPIPGEKVLGFISINGGVTIHRANCSNIKALEKNYPYRIIEVKWNNDESALSEVKICVVGDNEFGLLGTISNVIKEMNINVVNANFETKGNKFEGRLVLQISNTNLLNQLLKKLRALKGISEVQRI